MSRGMQMGLRFSFIIPVLNAERHLKRCLTSIRGQAYPEGLVEILALDGGSNDSTVEIAETFSCRVIQNPKRLAEYGLQAGIREATGDIVVIFAADNELASKDWLKKLSDVFEADPEVSAVWGPLRSGAEDPPVNRYFELIQSDPMTFFMNKNLERYLKDGRTEHSYGGYVFRIDPESPLAWGANGLAMRRSLVERIWAQTGYLGDNDAFQAMVEEGNNKVAFVPGLVTYHHHVGEVKDFVRKWKRNFSLHFLDKLETRNTNWVFMKGFRGRLVLWLLYSTNPFLTGAHAIYLMLRDRNPYWAYHPLLCFLQTCVYAWISVTSPKGRAAISKIARGAV